MSSPLDGGTSEAHPRLAARLHLHPRGSRVALPSASSDGPRAGGSLGGGATRRYERFPSSTCPFPLSPAPFYFFSPRSPCSPGPRRRRRNGVSGLRTPSPGAATAPEAPRAARPGRPGASLFRLQSPQSPSRGLQRTTNSQRSTLCHRPAQCDGGRRSAQRPPQRHGGEVQARPGVVTPAPK